MLSRQSISNPSKPPFRCRQPRWTCKNQNNPAQNTNWGKPFKQPAGCFLSKKERNQMPQIEELRRQRAGINEQVRPWQPLKPAAAR